MSLRQVPPSLLSVTIRDCCRSAERNIGIYCQLSLTGDYTSLRRLFAFLLDNECNGDVSTVKAGRLAGGAV